MQTDKIRIHSQSRRESELPHIQRKKMTSLRLLVLLMFLRTRELCKSAQLGIAIRMFLANSKGH